MVAVLGVLAVAGAEVPGLLRRNQKRELVVFGVLWLLGAGLAVGYSLGLRTPSLLSLLVEVVRPIGEAVFGPMAEGR
jgi:hypothetical protein